MAERGLFKRGHSTKAASTAERGIMMGIHAVRPKPCGFVAKKNHRAD
jgi:hypothetical protein